MKEEFKATREALFRPGRVDLRARFARPDEAQMRAALGFIFGGDDGRGGGEEQLEPLP